MRIYLNITGGYTEHNLLVQALGRLEKIELQDWCSLLIHCRHFTPRAWSLMGFCIHWRMGSGKLTYPPSRKAANSLLDSLEVLQWERSSAMLASLEEHLGIHVVCMMVPRAAETTLTALTMVVAHLSFLDLPAPWQC